MAVEHRRQRESQDEGRQHGVAPAPAREEHQAEQERKEQLDLRLDDAGAVALEDRRKPPRGRDHHQPRHHEKHPRGPGALHEQQRERQRRADVGHERGRHDQLSELGSVEPGLDEDHVDDGERGGGEGGTGDQGCLWRPVRDVGGVGRGGQERKHERRPTQQQARLELGAQEARIDLGSSEKREQDAAELGQEVEPRSAVKAQRVAGEHPGGDLDDGHGRGQLHGDDAGHEDEQRHERREGQRFHASPHSRDRGAKRKWLPPAGHGRSHQPRCRGGSRRTPSPEDRRSLTQGRSAGNSRGRLGIRV